MLACALAGSMGIAASQQDSAPQGSQDTTRPAPAFFGGPPGFGPGGFGPGPGGPGMGQEIELVDQFDKNSDGWLNTTERKAAKEHLGKQRAEGQGRRFGPGGPGGPPFGPRGSAGEQPAPKPGQKVSAAEVKSHEGKPLYAPDVLRTVFLEFESPEWEKELETFHGTDVDVPAKLTVDGKSYHDVGVRFRGMTSYMMVGTGYKRSLNLSVDMAHEGQNVLGHRTLNLLNSHEDPTFLRTVLSLQIAREYFPAPKANFVRVVINGESWGVYVNAEQFNKDFVKEWFDSTKGARWKVPGNPGGRGGLEYLGEDSKEYKSIYEIKSKDEPKSWARLIQLCRVLNETPVDHLEQALAPILDLDGALKFLAWDNALANGDGFWTRASDYNLYLDEKGRFHLIPHDANETFNTGGGPGGRGGPGGPGMRGFGPGMFLAPQMVAQADTTGDEKVSKAEFNDMARAWFAKLDQDQRGSVNQQQFSENLASILPPPQGPGGSGPPPGMGRGFGPAMFIGPALFTAADESKDGSVTEAELAGAFGKWFADWDTSKSGLLSEEDIRDGLNKTIPPPDFAQGPGGFGRGDRRGPGAQGPAGQGGGGRRGFGPGGPGGPGNGGPTLDPLVSADDSRKALASRLLSVPALKARYLGYVRDIAEKWLDWNKLGPVAESYQQMIADELKADTRKDSSYEAFIAGISGETAQAPGGPAGMRRSGSLKSFVEQRRAFLLSHEQVKAATAVVK